MQHGRDAHATNKPRNILLGGKFDFLFDAARAGRPCHEEAQKDFVRWQIRLFVRIWADFRVRKQFFREQLSRRLAG